MLTDFPEDDLLASIRHTVGVNWTTCGRPHGRVAVLGHEWGTDTTPVQLALRELVAAGATSVASSSAEPPCLFDTALLSECLWMHRSHAALAKSLDCLLHPTRGTAILTFCHHVPGHEGADLAFFQLCERTYNLVTVQPTNGGITRRSKCICASCSGSRDLWNEADNLVWCCRSGSASIACTWWRELDLLQPSSYEAPLHGQRPTPACLELLDCRALWNLESMVRFSTIEDSIYLSF
jgi:hypothetical protein